MILSKELTSFKLEAEKKLDFDLIILFSIMPIKFIFANVLAKILSYVKKNLVKDSNIIHIFNFKNWVLPKIKSQKLHK